MKRIVSLVLALSMVMSMFTFSFAGLKDVEGTEYEAAVEALVELRIVAGYPDGTFLPEKVVTRAELAKLLVTAYGLNEAAEASKGPTAFADVNADAELDWATGYINVAADYGFINGYPDGTFNGKATVTYAEAVTMCLRVLGYAREIEAKGTWPTNYMAKAHDLEILKDISYGSYNDGAKRGDTALLIWNMLRTNMWTVTGETEGDGLASAPNKEMLNVKFKGYAHSDKATFEGYTITSDKKEEKAVVYVSLSGDSAVADTYEYEANDFYTFVPGTEVEVLVNTQDGVILAMVPTGNDRLDAGTLEELDEAKYTNVPSDGDYAYVRLLRKDIKDSSILEVSSVYVEERDEKKDGIKINKTLLDFDEYAEKIILKDDERVSIKAIEEGDVFSTVTNGDEVFYVIGNHEVEGKLTKFVSDKNELTVGGKEYTLDTDAKFVEDPKDENEKSKTFSKNYRTDMKNEDVVLVLDTVVGKVVRIEFDGNIGDKSQNTTYQFFAITTEVERVSSRVYTVGLANEDGADDYKFAKDAEGKYWYNADEDLTGRFAAVKLNEDGDIVSITLVADADGAKISDGEPFEYDEDEHNSYIALVRDAAKYDEKINENALLDSSDAKIWDIDETVVVVTLLKDDKGTSNDSDDDVYSVEFSKGMEAIEDLKGEAVIVIYDDADRFDGAKYVVIYDEVSDKSDVKAGIMVEYIKNDLGDYEAEISTENHTEYAITKSDEGLADKKVIVYTTEEKVKNDVSEIILTVKATLDAEELSSGDSGDMLHSYIGSGDVSDNGKKADVTLPGGSKQRYEINKNFVDDYEEKVFVLVDVEEASKEEKEDGEGDYVVDTVEIVDINDLSLEEFDRISGDLENDEVIFIIRGMEERI